MRRYAAGFRVLDLTHFGCDILDGWGGYQVPRADPMIYQDQVGTIVDEPVLVSTLVNHPYCTYV